MIRLEAEDTEGPKHPKDTACHSNKFGFYSVANGEPSRLALDKSLYLIALQFSYQ